MTISKFGLRSGPTDVSAEILKELMKLNAQMEILVNEHIKHFREWSAKNNG